MTHFAGPSSPSSPHHRSHSRRHRSTVDAEPGGDGGVWAWFDGVTECLLYAVLAFSPLAFGVVAAWSREVFLVLVAAAAAVVAAKHAARAWAGRPSGYRWSWAYPVMLAFLALCAFQLVPLPAAWVRTISPGTLALKTDVLADLPDVSGLLRRVTITFYPKATVGQAVLVVAAAALFVVVLDVYRDPARIRRMLAAVAGVGLLLTAMAGYQNLTGSTTVYGVVGALQPNSGPFMVHSHFSQFVTLSIGAALALVLDRLAELSEFYRTPGEVWAALRQPRNAAVWVWAALCVAGPLMVMLSLARMGVISLVLAGVVTIAMLAVRGRATGAGAGRAWLLVGFGLAVFALLLAVGFNVVSHRLATLHDLRASGEGRQEMLRDMVGEFRRFPVLGTGLGTHEFVFGLFDRRNMATIATHAENEYAQLMEETGAAGVALAAAFLAGLVACYLRVTRRLAEPIDYAAFGLGFGLIAVLFHSWTDFGQHLPALAAVTAVYAGLLTSLARRRRSPSPAPPPARGRVVPAVTQTAVAVAVVAAAVAVGLWADRARVAEGLFADARAQGKELQAHDWEGSDATYANLIDIAGRASALEPADVEYRYWADLYRIQAIPDMIDPKTGADVARPEQVPNVQRLVADLDAARLLCPTYGMLLGLTGQVNRDTLGRADLGERQIRLAYRLSPYNLSICLIAGDDALRGHRWGEAATLFDRYALLGGPLKDYANDCVRAGHPEIPFDIVQRRHDRPGLLYLAGLIQPRDPRLAGWADRCRSEAAALLAADAADPDASPQTLAEQADADARRGRTADAVALYRRALAGEYGNVDWRLRLARCLLDAGRPADAATEARVVLQLRPDRTDAKALLAECQTRAATRPSAAR